MVIKLDGPLFKLNKLWQLGKNRVQWSLIPVGAQVSKAKYFAILTVNNHQVTWNLSTEKSSDAPVPHAFTDILKKHVSGYILTRVSRSDAHLCLHLHQPSQPQLSYILLCNLSGTSMIDLIDVVTNTSIARLSETSCYTKKRALATPLPDIVHNAAAFPNLLAAATPIGVDTDPEDDSDADGTPSARDPELITSPAFSTEQRDLIDQLKRRLRTLRKALSKREAAVVDDIAIAALKTEADLLKQYSYMVKDGDFELVIAPHLHDGDNTINVSLNPELSAGENLNQKYAAIKKLIRGVAQQQQQLLKHQRSVADLEDELATLRSTATTNAELATLRQRWHITRPSPQEPDSGDASNSATPYRTFNSQGVRIRVGKGATGNDRLTKMAKANDFWLHAVAATGSHVIVDGKSFKGELPPLLLHDAAILAIHFSKRRQDRASEVYVARRHGISKKKGMPAGLWSVDKAKSQFFRYTAEDLQRILNQMEPE